MFVFLAWQLHFKYPPWDDDDHLDEILVNEEEETAGKSLTIVPTNSSKK